MGVCYRLKDRLQACAVWSGRGDAGWCGNLCLPPTEVSGMSVSSAVALAACVLHSTGGDSQRQARGRQGGEDPAGHKAHARQAPESGSSKVRPHLEQTLGDTLAARHGAEPPQVSLPPQDPLHL